MACSPPWANPRWAALATANSCASLERTCEALRLIDEAAVVLFSKVQSSEITRSGEKVGLGLLDLTKLLDSGGMLARPVANESLVGKDGAGRGVELLGLVDFAHGFRIAPEHHEGGGVPVVSLLVAGIELEGALIFAEGGGHFPIPVKESEGERAMGLGEGVVESDGFAGSGDGAGEGLRAGHGGELGHEVVAFGETGVGLGVIRVMHDGLGECVDGLIETAFGSAAPVIAAFEVELFGFGVGAVMGGSVRIAGFVPGATQEAKGIEGDRDEGENEYGDGQEAGAGMRGGCGCGEFRLGMRGRLGRGDSGWGGGGRFAAGDGGGVEPEGEFVGPGEDAAAFAGQAVDGEAAFFLPAFDGALVPAEEGGDFLPGVDAAILCGTPNRPGRHDEASKFGSMPGLLG